MPQSEELPRQTMEEVLKNQLTLGQKIEELIEENRVLKQEEKWDFFKNYHRATIGLGAGIALNAENVPGSDMLSLDYVIFNHLIPGVDTVTVGYKGTPRLREAQPREIWNAILIRLMGVVFGQALNNAAKMSPEKAGGFVNV